MSRTLKQVQALAEQGVVRVSLHGYEELSTDNIRVRDVIEGLPKAAVVEDYPDCPKGPCVLVLQWDGEGLPIHVVWGSQQLDMIRRLCSSLRIGPTPRSGIRHGEGGGREPQIKQEIGSRGRACR